MDTYYYSGINCNYIKELDDYRYYVHYEIYTEKQINFLLNTIKIFKDEDCQQKLHIKRIIENINKLKINDSDKISIIQINYITADCLSYLEFAKKVMDDFINYLKNMFYPNNTIICAKLDCTTPVKQLGFKDAYYCYIYLDDEFILAKKIVNVLDNLKQY